MVSTEEASHIPSFWTNRDLLEKRFLAKVQKTRGCWIWIAGKGGSDSRPMMRDGPRQHNAAVIAYKLYRGPTNGLHVLHKCDNLLCVNPKHLFLGTKSDNIKDRDTKGRRQQREKKN